jgi:hypothetical protein
MPGLTLSSQGTNRIFRPDGKVVTVAGGAETVTGEWSSAQRRDANRIHYRFNGEEAEFDVKYSFNKDNQLVAIIPAAANGGADSPACTFTGRIVIDDNHDVAYELSDEEGEPTGETILVHGELSFPEVDKLTITLPGGEKAEIFGETKGKSNLDPAPNATSGQGGDLIQFFASTVNTINGSRRPADAIILFTGHWGVNENGLVFNAGLTAGVVKIQFGGTYKGVTAGLAYYAKDGEQEIAFTIHGEHQFKRPSGAEGSVNWLMTLGHSKQKIEAVAKLDITSHDAAGNKLTLGGEFQFVVQPGQPALTKTKISLDATYQMKGSQLVFAADFQKNGDRTSYNLRLEGKYLLRNNGQVDFVVALSKTAAGEELKISLGTVAGNDKLRAHLDAVVARSGSGKIDFSLNFDIRVRWVNGELVPSSTPQLA